MARILQTPSIAAIDSFDPLYDKDIDFYYEDNQPYKHRIVIINNQTNQTIYDKTIESIQNDYIWNKENEKNKDKERDDFEI